MNLEETRSAYYSYSGKASDVARQLSLAGIAVIWILRVGDKTAGFTFVPLLNWPLVGFVMALALDLAHYMYGSAAWGLFNRKKEVLLDNDNEKEFTAPPSINLISNILFWGKLGTVALSYAVLLLHMWRAL